jgi:cysteine-rich repeat protein
VTLPSTPGAKDVITITATSQTDSKVVAVMDIRISVKDTSCRVWGVHDKGLNDSQLFTVHSTDLQNFEVVGLGNLHEGYDLESLDINPLTGELYMASSTDGVEPGYLYKLNPRNEEGNLVLIGDIGFTRVDSLSFHPEGVLWGWERGQGLLKINPVTGLGELVIPYTEDVEDISWSVDGKLLYAVQHDELLVWDGNTLTTVCSMPRETEGIEAISENMLMFGAHGNKNVYVIDVNNGCQEISNIPTPYNDIEGIAWSASSCPLQLGSGNSVCGDNVIQPNEQCDDGNTTSGDGCSDVCLTE